MPICVPEFASRPPLALISVIGPLPDSAVDDRAGVVRVPLLVMAPLATLWLVSVPLLMSVAPELILIVDSERGEQQSNNPLANVAPGLLVSVLPVWMFTVPKFVYGLSLLKAKGSLMMSMVDPPGLGFGVI